MPRLIAVEPCPRCHERSLVAGACRACGHLEREALERCDDALPAGALPDRWGVTIRRRWIAGRGLAGAVAAGPLAGGAFAVLVLGRGALPAAALAAAAVAAAALGWVFAAMLANATTIQVRDRRLAVRHGPLPVPGARALSVPAAEIERLAMRRLRGGDRSGLFALEVHCRGEIRRLCRSPDREEVARLLRVLREALPAPRRSAR